MAQDWWVARNPTRRHLCVSMTSPKKVKIYLSGAHQHRDFGLLIFRQPKFAGCVLIFPVEEGSRRSHIIPITSSVCRKWFICYERRIPKNSHTHHLISASGWNRTNDAACGLPQAHVNPTVSNWRRGTETRKRNSTNYIGTEREPCG